MYYDDMAYPYPGIRFRNHTPEISSLQGKEHGDWCKLTKEEIKTLYRHSFRQTLAEVSAPNGQWKLGMAYGFLFISISLMFYVFARLFVVTPSKSVIELPEYKEALLYKKMFSRSGSVAKAYQFDVSTMRFRD
ncbi:unnamed protein product [Heterobilharzia americana]|nr:unnamed protein product [Heterobilharzia americana]